MDFKGQFRLNYPEDFRVACAINNLKHKDVLQYFVDNVSFYAFNGGDMEPVILWATDIIIDCRETVAQEIEPEKDQRIRRIALKYILLLNDLSEGMKLSPSAKLKESAVLMEEWKQEAQPYVIDVESFPLDETNAVKLTFDFTQVCKMNGISVTQGLQYYIDHISLPKDRAVNLLEYVETHPCMALFGTIMFSNSAKTERIPVTQEIQLLFAERLLLLDEVLKEEERVETRISKYRAFYAEWYDALKKYTN